jgi:glutathione synthase
MFALEFIEFCPKTLVTREIQRARSFAKELEGKVVIKPWDGNGGRGVLVSHYEDPNFRSMLEILTDEERQYILVQEYIPEVVEGDKRIIFVDGDPVGWMARVPQPGDHRGNMHVGAKVAEFELSDRDKEICSAIGPRLKELGLLFVGIDIIGEYLTEINVTSPTGIQEINPMMGISIESLVLDAVVLRYEEIGK